MPEPRKKTLPILAALATLAFLIALCMGGCSQNGTDPAGEAGSGTSDANAASVAVASLKGPTTIGLVDFMAKAESGGYVNEYSFSVAGTIDEILPGLVQGSVDIALIPANAAATVYNRTEGGISVVGINTLGVLSVVSGNEDIDNLSDLAGRTVVMTGKGTTPEYAMGFLLSQAGLDGSVELEFKSEATEVASLLANNPEAIAVLPEPYATAVCLQNEGVSKRIDLTREWDSLQEDGSMLVTGVTVVRNAFLEQHPQAVSEFLEGQADSVSSVNANPARAAELVVSCGIIENEAIAEAAIPSCNLVAITGPEMKSALSGYLAVLYGENPSSVGGSMPDDGFFAMDW